MATKYKYQRIISNPYLGVTLVVRGTTKAEVEQKIALQYAKWATEEARKREQYRLLDLEAQAERNNQNAQARIGALRELLLRGLREYKKLDWNAEKDNRSYSPFAFTEAPPTYEQAARTLGVPLWKPPLAVVFPGIAKKHEEMKTKARNQLQILHQEYEARKAAALRQYEETRRTYEQGRANYNASIDEKRRRFEAGDAEVMTLILKRIVDNINFPEGYGKDYELAFDSASGTAVISMQLPGLVEVPRIVGYRFVRSRKAVDPIEMKPKEFEALYDSVIYQMALLTINRSFREAYTLALRSIVFNGWVTGIDRATGNEFTSCILSVQAPREMFQSINLERVDPRECIRSLKGLVAGPLAQLAPVRPIMELNTDDQRFVASREILANLSDTDNLATMDWEDFEHLVRELFGKVFGGYGSEVRVTQASRDGGVDAIAFDPDPIRGGKFVIQAKRYNRVVPVSAARDLYGTMINEGAVKGILVTTSYYGNDSREFVKDKPITLIDGANLVYMFQQHGYNVSIELQQ